MWSNHKREATNVTLERRLSKSAKESLMAGETSPNSTTGLDDFNLGEGISPGGNEELLDSLIDIADENSPRRLLDGVRPTHAPLMVPRTAPRARSTSTT